MYQSYFGLKEQAFSIAVDPRYLYMSRQHQEALAHLIYGIQGGGFVMLSGEVGTGKTTIVKQLLEQLPANTDIAIILNPMSNVIELLSTICEELDIQLDNNNTTIKRLTDALHAYLLNNYSQNRNTVLLIDEAQLLSAEVLEQLRLLTNLETNAKKLLQIILVGQPELNALLSQPRLRQLSQRITARFHLKPLNIKETHAYINHRLTVAGMPTARNPFTERIIKKVHAFSGGIPRRINVLCERMLMGAYGHNKTTLDMPIFNLAKSEIIYNLGENNVKTKANWFLPTAVGLFCIALTAACMFLWLSPKSTGLIQQRHPNNLHNEMATQTLPNKTPLKQTPPKQTPPKQTPLKQLEQKQPTPAQPLPTQPSAPITSVTVAPNFPKPLTIESPFLLNTITAAQTQLFTYLNITPPNKINPCLNLQAGYNCAKQAVTSWQELKDINRPAIIALNLPGKIRAYALITGMNTTTAQLSYYDNNQIKHHTLALAQLGEYWSGMFWYTWFKPNGFNTALSKGQNSIAVTWLANTFATIDQKEQPLAQTQFNNALEKRVQIFQRNQGLTSDGIVGNQTLLTLNLHAGIDKKLEEI